MRQNRVGICLFCEDVRQEIGNKVSFMGAFTNDSLTITGALPAILPIFCVCVWIVCEIDDIPKACLIRILFPDGATIYNQIIDMQSVEIENFKDANKVKIGCIVKISPVLISSEGVLEVWVDTEREPFRAGRLTIVTGSMEKQAMADSATA